MKVKQKVRDKQTVQLNSKGYARLYLRFNYTENYNVWHNEKNTMG